MNLDNTFRDAVNSGTFHLSGGLTRRHSLCVIAKHHFRWLEADQRLDNGLYTLISRGVYDPSGNRPLSISPAFLRSLNYDPSIEHIASNLTIEEADHSIIKWEARRLSRGRPFIAGTPRIFSTHPENPELARQFLRSRELPSADDREENPAFAREHSPL